jgi:hypothetical protein
VTPANGPAKVLLGRFAFPMVPKCSIGLCYFKNKQETDRRNLRLNPTRTNGQIGLFDRNLRPAYSIPREPEAEVTWKVTFSCNTLTGGKPNGECRLRYPDYESGEPAGRSRVPEKDRRHRLARGWERPAGIADPWRRAER